MLNKRFADLLEAAADALAECRDPFSLDFLGKHRVTATECIDLSNLMSIIVNGYLTTPEWIQQGMLLTGSLFANGDRRTAKEMWPLLNRDEVVKRLKATGP